MVSILLALTVLQYSSEKFSNATVLQYISGKISKVTYNTPYSTQANSWLSISIISRVTSSKSVSKCTNG